MVGGGGYWLHGGGGHCLCGARGYWLCGRFLMVGCTTLPSEVVAICNYLRTNPFAARSCGLQRCHIDFIPLM